MQTGSRLSGRGDRYYFEKQFQETMPAKSQSFFAVQYQEAGVVQVVQIALANTMTVFLFGRSTTNSSKNMSICAALALRRSVLTKHDRKRNQIKRRFSGGIFDASPSPSLLRSAVHAKSSESHESHCLLPIKATMTSMHFISKKGTRQALKFHSMTLNGRTTKCLCCVVLTCTMYQ